MKKIVVLIAAMLMLTACHPTPEHAVVVGKDLDRMIELATGSEATLISELGAEDVFRFDESGADGKLQINADAPVLLPDAQMLPLINVSKGTITQEQSYDIFDYIYPNEDPYDADVFMVTTKSEIEYQILMLEEEFAQGNISKDQYDRDMEYFEDEFKNAPETKQIVTTDGTFKVHPEIANMLGANAFAAQDYNEEYAQFDQLSTLDITSVKMHEQDADYYPSVSVDYFRSYQPYEFGDSYPIGEYSGQMPEIPLAEAKNTCEEILEVFGFDNYYTGEILVNVGEKYLDSPSVDRGYTFIFGREYEGIRILWTGDYVGRIGEGYSSGWAYEIFKITLDHMGIAEINWSAPIEFGEQISQGTVLLPYEEISGIAQTMLLMTYEGIAKTLLESKWDVDVDITQVELCLVPIRKPDDEVEAVLVPAWVYHGNAYATDDTGAGGYLTGMYSLFNESVWIDGMDLQDMVDMNDNTVHVEASSDFPTAPLVVINAIDGSIINLRYGY